MDIHSDAPPSGATLDRTPAPVAAPQRAPAPSPPAPAPAGPSVRSAVSQPGMTPMTVPSLMPQHPVCALGDGQLQIVDEEKRFTENLEPTLDKWGMLDKGFNFNMVAVFGSQSTGKSTLLNRLFGTTFDVMDEAKRQQTTKGIWMCPSIYSSTLVMDVEGTDGRERGEDQDFERKSALFSLASTEVLLVNLWEHQIGLYQGANMGLLKTVFEVNLSLFGGSQGGGKPGSPREKTLILFVIRDHVGATPLENLTATLTQDMLRIWDSLSKPDHLKDAKLTTYFDLSFAALPHKILMPQKFEDAVIDLRKRFTDRSRPDYVFQPAYSRHIPADGIAFYMEGIWQQVLTNKDLDLPTQQELLAQFRCQEIAAGVTEIFVASAKPLRRPIEQGSVVAGMGASMADWLQVALSSFDTAASRYHAGVYQRKRLELLTTLFATLLPLYMGQLKNAHKAASSKFVGDIAAALKQPTYDFAEVVTRCTKEARHSFLGIAEEATIPGADWTFEQELAHLDEDLKTIADTSRSDETKKLINGIDRKLTRQIAEPVEVTLAKPSATMWNDILTMYRDVVTKAEEAYLSKAKSYNCTPEENEAALGNLRHRAWVAFRKKLQEQTADTVLLSTLRDCFEERFRYDDQGVPRVWKPEDDLDGAFKKAREETLALLPTYATVKPTDPDLLPSLPTDVNDDDVDADAFDPSTAFTLVSTARLHNLEARFKREADASYVEAKRSMVSSVSQIPVWMYGLLVALGWNEAMAVLFNPLYFALLVIAAASAYIILQLGLAGPLLQVMRTVINEVRRIATDKLREAFAEPPAVDGGRPQRRLAEPVSAVEKPRSRPTRTDRVDRDRDGTDGIDNQRRTNFAPAAAPDFLEK